MAERTNKRLRRMSTEDSEGADDWTPEDAFAGGNTIRVGGRPRGDTNESAGTSRSRRVAASKQRSLSPAPETSGKRTLRLTVKAPPNRLRQVAASSTRGSLARNSKNKAPILDFSEEEDDGEDELEDNDGEGDEEIEEDEDELAEEDDGEEEEGEEDEDEPDDPEDEDEDASGDVDMEDAATMQAPRIKISAPSGAKPSPAQVLKSHGSKIKSVEDQEMEDGSGEDEELSDLGSDEDEGDDDDEDDDDEDGEGADEDNDIIAANNVDGADDLDSEMDESAYDSRGGTPDLTKLTRRQRSQYQEDGDGLMALSNEAQKKKFFTAEQITMRRAEMARRRKDLSEKRNEEEKADTLKRLLHKPTHKRRSRLQLQQTVDEDAVATPGSQEIEIIKPSAIYVRSISNKDGTTLGVPEEWIGTPVGRIFSGDMAPAQPVTRDSWGLSTFIEVVEETTTPEVSGQA